MTLDKRNEDGELVSVIIPTYNRINTLGRAVNSVLNQTYTNLELLIIDDGSEDGTEEYVRGIGDQRIRYYRNAANMGPAASRNRGAQLARGTWLAFQDSDDEWQPDKLQRLLYALRQMDERVAVVYHEMQEMDGEHEVIPSREIPYEKKTGNIFAYMLLYPLIGIPASLIRKNCFQECGGFCERLKSLEDYEFFLRLSQKYRILFVEEPLIKIYDTAGSVNKRYKDKIDTKLYVLNRWYDELAAVDLLERKLELIRMQAENYECEDYFYDQILKLCAQISDLEKKKQIWNCTKKAALKLRQNGMGDRAIYYRNATGQMERLVSGLSRLQDNLRENPSVIWANWAGIHQALGETLADVMDYAKLVSYPRLRRMKFPA